MTYQVNRFLMFLCTHHEDGADGMGEEQDGVDPVGPHTPSGVTEPDWWYVADIHVFVSVISCYVMSHGDCCSYECNMTHHDEGRQLADGVEDAKHLKGHQESGALGDRTI